MEKKNNKKAEAGLAIDKSGKAIDAMIVQVRTSRTKFNNLVQAAIVAIARHAKDYGDCTRAVKLVQAMGETSRRTLVVNAFNEYTPIRMNVKKGLVRMAKVGDKNYTPFNIQGLEANPWFDVKEADKEAIPDTTLVDVRDALSKLADRFTKRADSGKVAANDANKIRILVGAMKKLAAA